MDLAVGAAGRSGQGREGEGRVCAGVLVGAEAGEGEDDFFYGILDEDVDFGGVCCALYSSDERGFEGRSGAGCVVIIEGALGGGGKACVVLESGVEIWLNCSL